jgi:tetratricopeptide (TPR) repeat protein
MVRKNSSIIVLGLCALASTLPAFGADDPASQLKQAESLVNNKQFEQAEEVYLDIARQAVDAQQRLAAQKGLAILYVRWDKEAQADKALQDLIAGFSQNKAIASAVTNVADAYRQVEKHTKACEIYQYVIDNWPADEHAMWSQMGLVISNIYLGNTPAADAAFEQLRTNYSGHKLLGPAICLVADAYRALKNYQQSGKLYQLALAAQPDDEYTLWSQMGLAISNMHLGQYDTASDQIQTILTRFVKDQRISIAACLTADQYRAVNRHKEAAVLYEYVVNNWPGAEHTLWSQMGLAISNLWLGKEELAQQATQKLLADFAKDPRVSRAVCWLADEFRKRGNCGSASTLYQYVLENWPESEHALWSRMGLAMCNLWMGNSDSASAAADKLLTDYAKDSRQAVAVCLLADEYRKMEQHAKARELYSYVVKTWPDTEHAMWSQMGLAISCVRLGEDTQAQSAIEQLARNFSTCPKMSQAVEEIVREYRQLQQYDKAEQVKQYVANVLNNRPATTGEIWPEVAKLTAKIGVVSDDEVTRGIDRIMVDFRDNPQLAAAVALVADTYLNKALSEESDGREEQGKGYYRKAIAAWERIITQLPQSPPTTVEACFMSGFCYQRLREYEKAVERYQQVANWPEYQRADEALFRTAQCFNELATSGRIPEADAAMMIEELCTRLASQYPSSGMNEVAQSLLKYWRSANRTGESK